MLRRIEGLPVTVLDGAAFFPAGEEERLCQSGFEPWVEELFQEMVRRNNTYKTAANEGRPLPVFDPQCYVITGIGTILEGLDEAALALPARKLSGGQKRRTALLRALWAPGDTLLLDEPFTGMDPAAVQASIALLRERVEGRPVLLATHDRAAIDALGWPMLELQKLAQPDAACNSTNKGLQ